MLHSPCLFWNCLATTTQHILCTQFGSVFVYNDFQFLLHSSVTICLISFIKTSISSHDIHSSLCGLALFASKVMDMLSPALSCFPVEAWNKNDKYSINWQKLLTDGSYQLTEVINWRKLSTDGSYLLIKVREVRIAIELKRSDDWWRFACGDVYPLWGFSMKIAYWNLS